MTTSDERFQKGKETRSLLAGGGGRSFEGSVPSAYELAPDMYKITTEFLYGTVWTREGLDTNYRAMITLSAMAAQRTDTQVRSAIRVCLDVGVTADEIVEVLMMASFNAGIPAGHRGLAIAKEVFEERGIQYKATEVYDSAVSLEERYRMGFERHSELMPDVFGYHTTEPTSEEKELDDLMTEYYWGSIWTRPGLDIKSRAICTLASTVAQGRYDNVIRRTIEASLRVGVTRTELMEMFIHLSLYVGVMPARAAMNIATSIFRSPEFTEP